MTTSLKIGVFMALAVFAPLACAAPDDLEMNSEQMAIAGADLLSEQLDSEAIDLLDVDSREMPRENVRLLSENARLHAEIAQLRAENSRLKGTETTADFESMLDEGKKKKCPHHCNKSCKLPGAWFDKTCKMSEEFFNNQTQMVKAGNVVFNGHYCDVTTQNFFCSSSKKHCDRCKGQYKTEGAEARHPTQRWSLYGGDGAWLGAVTCPCTDSHGNTMSEADAIRRIAGQVAALGIPRQHLKPICESFQAGNKKDWRTVTWNTKIVLSTLKMLHCWKAKCASGSTKVESSVDVPLQAQGGDAAAMAGLPLLRGRSVELQLDDSFGGGSYC